MFAKPKRENNTIKSKKLRAKNSVKSIKDSLFGLHKDESKTIVKPSQQDVKHSKDHSMYQDDKNFSREANNNSIMDIESSVIPNDLPLNTKKFIEVKTGETIYLTSDDGMYTEDEK